MKQLDVAVIGGGVAGLWAANALKSRGYSIALFTNTPLGAGQSLAAQGVIHGGAKYALAGKLTDASEELAAMPNRWRDAIHGKGDVDLTGTRILSDHQILWSLPDVASKVMSFFGSKLMRGRSDALPKSAWPEALDPNQYKGSVFRIDEPVLDPVSVIEKLSEGLGDVAYFTESIHFENGELVANGSTVDAKFHLLTAGSGNGALLDQLGITSPQMQLRPLHQVIVRGDLPDFYSVCIGSGPKPPIVTTTHVDSQGRKLWWIGGDIAEARGVARSESEQIDFAKEKLSAWLPWLKWDTYDFFTARADRAEPKTESGERPPGAFCQRIDKYMIGWPTKLALAPNLGDQVLNNVSEITPSGSSEPLNFPKAQLGRPPWDIDA